MPYPCAGGDAADAGRGQHGGGVALVLLLLLELGRVGGRAGGGVVVVAAVAVGVAEEAALVVGGRRVVVRVGARGSVGARRKVGGGIPLRAAGGLLDVAVFFRVSFCAGWFSFVVLGEDLQPALAVLVPLLGPARWHWWRGSVRRGRTLGCGRSRVVLLRGVALAVALLWLAVALRRTSVLLWWLTILLLGRLTVLLLGRLAVLLLRWAALVVVAIRHTTVARSSTTRCSVGVTVGRLRRRVGRLFQTIRNGFRDDFTCKSLPVGLSLGLSSSSSNSFIFFLRKSMFAIGFQVLID